MFSGRFNLSARAFWCAAILPILLGAGLFPADGLAADPAEAVFLTDGTAWMSDFGNALAQSLEEQGITLRVVPSATPLPEAQAEKLMELEKSSASVLIVWPANPFEAGATFKNGRPGKPLLLLGADVPDSGRKAAIVVEPETLGRVFAGLIRQCVPEGLLICMLTRHKDDPWIASLRKSLKEALQADEIVVRQEAEDRGDPGVARENARELFEKHPELAGYVAVEPYELTAVAAAAADTRRAGYVGLVGTGWPGTLGEPLEKGFINGVVSPDVRALAALIAPMIRAAAAEDGTFAWPESGQTAMPLATRITPKPYGLTEMLHGLPGNWDIKVPAGKPEPPAGKFD